MSLKTLWGRGQTKETVENSVYIICEICGNRVRFDETESFIGNDESRVIHDECAIALEKFDLEFIQNLPKLEREALIDTCNDVWRVRYDSFREEYREYFSETQKPEEPEEKPKKKTRKKLLSE